MASLFNDTPLNSVAEARRLVEEIREETGFLPEETLDVIGPPGNSTRHKVESALLKAHQTIGRGVLTLAKNLYTSSARFVFELLQNAEDNKFTRAEARGELPYISFQILTDKIILECNEDGFTPKNLRAICTVGASSKVGVQPYIGEKGIGFKSVFMAAWRVHIQSNALSFTLTHRIGDSGLGMFSPVWQESAETLDGSFTRITLFLHQHDDKSIQEQRYNEIVSQFNELRGTVLLFLQNLREIRITVYEGSSNLESRTQYTKFGTNPVAIRKTSQLGKDPKVDEYRWYHVTKRMVSNVPASENRTYADGESSADATTEIVLAFPLVGDPTPLVEDQDVFAFLPMRPMGFKFIIHADFVTEASRQDIVTTSRRNQSLRIGIAQCFLDAILQLCEHPNLQFQWMRWLPQRHAYPWNTFWKEVLVYIENGVRDLNVFRCELGDRTSTISSVRPLEHSHLDKAGKPLFNDLLEVQYLSQKYDKKDLNLLKPYGLNSLSVTDIVDIISSDLKKGSNISGPEYSHMRTRTGLDDDWHSRAARLILLCLNEGDTQERQRISLFKIVPLSTGTWASAQENSLYYPLCEGKFKIPDSLDLKLVSSLAANNPDRRALFDKLGVSTAAINFIQRAIILYQLQPREPTRQADIFSLKIAVSHLVFMYLTHSQKWAEPVLFSRYEIYSDCMQRRNTHKLVTYLQTSHQHEPFEVLKGAFKGWFIHSAYLENPPATPPGTTLPWADWICKYLGVRRHIRLIRSTADNQEPDLSAELLYVLEKHPMRFMGVLQRSWALDGSSISKSPALIDKIRALRVTCKGGTELPLQSTYLPLPELGKSFSCYAEGETFPFLELPEPLTTGSYQKKWGFLIDVFGVGYTADLNFYLQALQAISKDKDSQDAIVQRESRFLELYQSIQGSSQTVSDRLGAWRMIRELNREEKLILIPSYGARKIHLMASPGQCVWAGQGHMQSLYPLEYIYEKKFNLDSDNLYSIKQYFRVILKIPDCGWEHYTDEIRYLKRTKKNDFDWINALYTLIHQIQASDENIDAEKLREVFRSEPLIYAPGDGSDCWHTVSQCIWSSATHIQGRVPLNEVYPDLEEFFTDFLGVARLTLKMAYDELKSKEKRNPAPSLREIKDTIFVLNSLLSAPSDSGDDLDSRGLLECKIFPVRHPTANHQTDVRLTTGRAEFAIIDRQLFYEAFESQVKFLDFTLDEIRRLEPFISWLNFSRRYLSVAVKEISIVRTKDHASTLIRNSDRGLVKRAHSLLRVATHYDSPRTKSLSERMELYKMLREAEVYETDGISSELHLSQDGHDFKFVKNMSELHIRETKDGVLEIYVPRDPDRQDLCYYETLPPRLLDWLMTDPTTNLKPSGFHTRGLDVMTSVLNARVGSMTRLLLHRGIIDVDVPEGDDTGEYDEGLPTLEEQEESQPRQQPGSQGAEEESDGETIVVETISATTVSSRHAYTDFPRSQGQVPDSNPDLAVAAAIRYSSSSNQTDYVSLLSHVISSARSAVFPHQGAFNMSRLAAALPIEEGEDGTAGEWRRRFHSRVPLERDMKIGAAGELFVFELLCRLNPRLPNFSRANWQSTIRKFATAHPFYADMEPWSGRETADIVYPDQTGAFTELLLDRGYLEGDAHAWEGKTPTYLIEVKTTTLSANAPFFVSRRQFQRMREHVNAIDSSTDDPTIYIIFRVFNVDRDSIGVKLYLDPEKLRRNGLLVFREQVYCVTPGVREIESN
ncbi:hypothetical protein F5Y01DRAFT_50390 [Xylaria sp. FL0043]|nr:hypothetical protein F5Y01DRAFT_50390 [Xylaria sp. FL0043]